MTAADAKRAKFVAGLRELAAFIETHPDLPVPSPYDYVGPYLGLAVPETDNDRRAEVDRIASVLGVTPQDDGGNYQAARRFGPITYKAVAIHSADMAKHQAHMSYDGAVQPAQVSR